MLRPVRLLALPACQARSTGPALHAGWWCGLGSICRAGNAGCLVGQWRCMLMWRAALSLGVHALTRMWNYALDLNAMHRTFMPAMQQQSGCRCCARHGWVPNCKHSCITMHADWQRAFSLHPRQHSWRCITTPGHASGTPPGSNAPAAVHDAGAAVALAQALLLLALWRLAPPRYPQLPVPVLQC